MRLRVEPPPVDPSAPPRPPKRLRVFALEPTTVQLDWTSLGPGPVRFRCADTEVVVAADGGPGAVVLDGLPAAMTLRIHLDGAGIEAPEQAALEVTTLANPPGEELFRFGAITDLHLGSHRFGRFGTITEHPEPEVAHPVRCARAAIDAMHSWGAETLLVKGDLTESSRPQNWADVADLVERADVPVLIAPGNHETHRRSTVDPEVEAARHGLKVLRSAIEVSDHPGVRIILGDTPIDGTDVGRIGHIADDIFDAASASDRPVVLAVHHHFQRWKTSTHPPPGIPGPEAREFLGRLALVRPDTLITSGHTHRHRMRRHGPLVLVETGSTKDYPGTWAGYVAHEGGIRQVVRRIAEPSCIRWTEWSARAALGMWRHWSPGSLSQRCFTHTWPL